MGVIGNLVDRATGAEQLDPVRDAADAQRASDAYWRTASHTDDLASSAYFDRRANALENVLRQVPDLGPVVDVGCGTGRYTRLAARHFANVTGLDIGTALIEDARRAADAEGSLATFEVGVAGDELPRDLGLVMGIGLTCYLIEDEAFAAFLADMAQALTDGGSLILVDSLSRREDALTRFSNGYVARYRDRQSYLSAMRAAGLILVQEQDLGKPSRNRLAAMVPGRRMNRLFWFRR